MLAMLDANAWTVFVSVRVSVKFEAMKPYSVRNAIFGVNS